MNSEFQRIVSQIPDEHYADNEIYYNEVLKEPYQIFISGNIGLINTYMTLPFGFRVGYSRGGLRFNPEKMTLDEYKVSISEIRDDMRKSNYLYILLDHLRPNSQFTELFRKNKSEVSKKGTAIIYPKPDWISKFKSKDRYNLTYAGKKGVEIEIYQAKDFDKVDLEAFNEILEKSKIKARGSYFLPSLDQVRNIAQNIDSYFVFARLKDKYISFNISVLNTQKTRLERVFAGSDKNYASIRAPEYLELKFVEFLAKEKINYYDLWMLNEGDGFTAFKAKLADVIIDFAPRSALFANKLIGKPYLFFSKLKAKLLN